jgi:hypothetical protein
MTREAGRENGVKRSRKERSTVRENGRGKPLRVGCKGGGEKLPELEDEGGSVAERKEDQR